jgi:hypothetical protein
LVKLLEATPEYKPNEKELKVENLKALVDIMLEKNTAAIKAGTDLNHIRMARNEILYDEQMGLVALSRSIKAYMKSVYGTNHPKFKEVAGISFRGLYSK